MKKILKVLAAFLVCIHVNPTLAEHITTPQVTLLSDNWTPYWEACVFPHNTESNSKKNIHTDQAVDTLASNPISLNSRWKTTRFRNGEKNIVTNNAALSFPSTRDDNILITDNVVMNGNVVTPPGECNIDLLGAIPDDGIDDTAAIQAANDSSCETIIFPKGVYTINRSPQRINGKPCGIKVSANKTFKTNAGATINIGASFDLDGIAFMNGSGSAARDTYHDKNITFKGLRFTDSRVYPSWNLDSPATYGPSQLPASALTGSIIRLFSCDRPILEDLEFDSIPTLCVAIGGCNGPEIRNVHFKKTGYLYRGAYALWISANPANGSYTKRPRIINTTFDDIKNAAMMCGKGVSDVYISNLRVTGAYEAGLHLPNPCKRVTVIGADISKIKLGDISAHGIEAETLSDAVITGFNIRYCDVAGMAFVGIKDSLITSGYISNNGAAKIYPTGLSSVALGIAGKTYSDLGKAGIKIINYAGDGAVDNVSIKGVKITDNTGTGNQKYAISLGQTSPSAIYGSVIITENNFTTGGSIDDIYMSSNALASKRIKIFNNSSGRISRAVTRIKKKK